MLFSLLLALVVGTWNGNWFPSGRAEHRAAPEVEEATTRVSARLLARALATADPAGTNDVILVLNEMRGPKAASNLVACIGRRNLRVVSVSGYRRRDRFDTQQDVIATTLPVADSSWSRWRQTKSKYENPPRGYAFAAVVVEPAVTARVYAVHLKSNYGANTKEKADQNRAKRAAAVTQLIDQERPRGKNAASRVIIAGDFNADRWRKEFSDERTFPMLEAAGFDNPLALLPPNERGTHPSARYGDSALDYVFTRGFSAAAKPVLSEFSEVSDHRALFVVLTVAH